MKRREGIIFGISQGGLNTYEECKERFDIVGFADNNEKMWGKKLLGLKIISPQELVTNNEKYIIIGSSKYFNQIVRQLYSMNVDEKRIVSRLMVIKGDIPDEILKEKQKIHFLNNNRVINIGETLKRHKSEWVLDSITFLHGGSEVLDYLLLRYIVLKYKVTKYMEIGSYIGESIKVISDKCEKCISLSLPAAHKFQAEWLEKIDMPNHGGKMMNEKNLEYYATDSRYFDFSILDKDIELYFIDADHSYMSVLSDSINIFSHREQDSFVIWHDCMISGTTRDYNYNVLNAIKDAIGEEKFENVFLFNNNKCGIYIPPKYQSDFVYISEVPNDVLHTYRVSFIIDSIQ